MDYLTGMLSLPIVDPSEFLIRGDTPIVLGCFMLSRFPREAVKHYCARGYTARIVYHLGIEYAQIEPFFPSEKLLVEKNEEEEEAAIAELAELVEAHAKGLVKKIREKKLVPSNYDFVSLRFDMLALHPRQHPLFLVDLLKIHLRPTACVKILLKEMRQNGYGCASPDGKSEDAWDHILRNVGSVRVLPGRDFFTVFAPPIGHIAEACSEGLLCYSIERDTYTDEGMMHFTVRPTNLQIYSGLDL